jgi:hypothetical protein
MTDLAAPASAHAGYSPAQLDALEKLDAQYPATHFVVIAQLPFSNALRMEACDTRATACSS